MNKVVVIISSVVLVLTGIMCIVNTLTNKLCPVVKKDGSNLLNNKNCKQLMTTKFDEKGPVGEFPGGDFPGGELPGGNLPGGNLPGGNLPGGDGVALLGGDGDADGSAVAENFIDLPDEVFDLYKYHNEQKKMEIVKIVSGVVMIVLGVLLFLAKSKMQKFLY